MTEPRSHILGSREHPGLTGFRRFNVVFVGEHLALRVAGANYNDQCAVTYRTLPDGTVQLHEELVYSLALSTPERLRSWADALESFAVAHGCAAKAEPRCASSPYASREHQPGAVIKGWRAATAEEAELLATCLEAARERRRRRQEEQRQREANRAKEDERHQLERFRGALADEQVIALALKILKEKGNTITITPASKKAAKS